jgi:hypothetical protein
MLKMVFQEFLDVYPLQIIYFVNIEAILPLIVSGMLMLYTIYNNIVGAEKNILRLYNLNMLLFFPEVFSFSKLDWLALLGLPNLFTNIRSYQTVLFTGLIIMGGYVVLILGSRFKENVRRMEKRRIEQEEIDEVFFYQSGLSILTVIAALAIVTFISFSIPFIKNQIHIFLNSIPHAYAILGILTILIVTATLAVFLRDRLYSQNETLNKHIV